MIKANVTHAARQAMGRCIDCGAQDERTLSGKVCCAECAKKRNEFMRERIAIMKDLHRCPRCGKDIPKEWPYHTCKECLAKQKLRYRQRHPKNI